eukprot:gene15963-4827_t
MDYGQWTVDKFSAHQKEMGFPGHQMRSNLKDFLSEQLALRGFKSHQGFVAILIVSAKRNPASIRGLLQLVVVQSFPYGKKTELAQIFDESRAKTKGSDTTRAENSVTIWEERRRKQEEEEEKKRQDNQAKHEKLLEQVEEDARRTAEAAANTSTNTTNTAAATANTATTETAADQTGSSALFPETPAQAAPNAEIFDARLRGIVSAVSERIKRDNEEEKKALKAFLKEYASHHRRLFHFNSVI